MTLDQALLVLVGGTAEKDQVQDLRIEAQVRWLLKFAEKHGLTPKAIGELGVHQLHALITEKNGTGPELADLSPVLNEPEFIS